MAAIFSAPQPPLPVTNIVNDGPYSLPPGTTKNKATPTNTPVRRRVRLHDQFTGTAIREHWSDAITGAYQFVGVRAGTFYVVSLDHTGQYSGVIESDIVVPASLVP